VTGPVVRHLGTTAPTLGTWVALCASAEAVGMTAAAGAARLSQGVMGGEPSGGRKAVVVVALAAGDRGAGQRAGLAPGHVVIFLGATAPGPGWPAGAVVLLGAVTGLVAGAVLGAVTALLLPSLDGP